MQSRCTDVSVHTHTHTHTRNHTHEYISEYMHVCAFVWCLYACVHTHMCTCRFVCACICKRTCTHRHTRVHIDVCVHTHVDLKFHSYSHAEPSFLPTLHFYLQLPERDGRPFQMLETKLGKQGKALPNLNSLGPCPKNPKTQSFYVVALCPCRGHS
jgi:hypothetical protein